MNILPIVSWLGLIFVILCIFRYFTFFFFFSFFFLILTFSRITFCFIYVDDGFEENELSLFVVFETPTFLLMSGIILVIGLFLRFYFLLKFFFFFRDYLIILKYILSVFPQIVTINKRRTKTKLAHCFGLSFARLGSVYNCCHCLCRSIVKR